jgi:2-octaprenyl-6-methoxyphenol hydroxylase
MFKALGAWDLMAPHMAALQKIIVTDAKAPGFPRPSLLRFLEDSEGSSPSAYFAENRHIVASLLEVASASPHITFATHKTIATFDYQPGLVHLTTAGGEGLGARLLVAADGRHSAARASAGIKTVGWSYGQTAIVTAVGHELPHHGRAEENFLPAGPFAILPLPGRRSSLVWTEKDADAQRLMALNDDGFLGELKIRFGTRLGDVWTEGPRQAYPLSLSLAQSFVAARLALIGDAAHVVHPIAGLGFNLGLRDSAALAECVHRAQGLGLDIGAPQVLKDYERWRRFDTVATALATDGLNRLFANDDALLRLLRDAGLRAVNSLPPLKRLFMQEAAGQTGTLPRLMRGETL